MRTIAALIVLLAASCVLLPATQVSADDEKGKGKQAARKKDGPSIATLVWAREVVAERLELGERAPEFATDRDWLNVARPITLAEDLKGKVVILDFWCYCCINCLHVLPDLAYLEERYKDKPFAVVGVHSAKFENEKDADQIRQAILRYDIHHPVVNDADFAIWKSYGARAWPTFAVIAPDGTFVGVLSGEGRREELDALTQALLERFGQTAPKTLSTKPLPMRLEKTTKTPGMLSFPGKVLADATRGSLFIADTGHHRIVEVGLDGTFKRAFGSGERGFKDGAADEAQLAGPQGMTIHDGHLWVCDTKNHALRRINLETGWVSTAAGTGAQGNHWTLVRPRQPQENHGPWPGKTTALNSPWDIEFLDGVGHIAMAGSHSMWTIDPKTMQVRHSGGDLSERRYDNEDAYRAAFAQPSGLATDGKVLYIADSESSAIVSLLPGGAVTTIAGAEKGKPRNLFHFGDEDGVGWGKRFQHPLGVEVVGAHVWVADAYNHKIKRLEPKRRTVVTAVGDGVSGHHEDAEDTTIARARFAEPSGLSWANGILYVADTNNHVIRRLRLPKDATKLGAIDTLPLKGVPIPMVHAKGGTTDAWPVLPGTATGVAVKTTVQAGKPFDVTLSVLLPDGWKFTDGAPSVARIEWPAANGTTEFRDTKITGATTKVTVPALATPGTQKLTLRVLYYVCTEGGACRMRGIDFPLTVTVSPDPQPPGPVGVADIFVP